MKKIIILNLKFSFCGVDDVIHPVVLKDEKNMVLIDCGYTGFFPHLKEAMEAENLDLGQLTHVFITHQDHDHMGALCSLKQKYPSIKVVASEIEEPYISGKLKSLRLEQAEAMQVNLPEEQKAFGTAFINVLRAVEPVEVDWTVSDGDWIDWCGGCQVVGTPGHTPGHISLYIEKERTFIAGDAAALDNGSLIIANPQFTLDMENARKSLDRIINAKAEKIICYHGGVFIPRNE